LIINLNSFPVDGIAQIVISAWVIKMPEIKPIEHRVTAEFVMLECPICHRLISAETYRACYLRFKVHLCSVHNIC